MTFPQSLRVLRARWRLAAFILFVIVAAAVALSLIVPKKYTATASVVANAKLDPVVGLMYPSQQLLSEVATQVDIISSERVARRVVKVLKLDEIPSFQESWREDTEGRGDIVSWLAQLLQLRLLVLPSRDSNVINISIKWPDAKAAATLANAFAQAYIDTSIELKVEPARQYASWFEERLRVLRADLVTKQRRLSDYQNKTGIVATDDRLDIETARLGELSTALVAVQAQRQDAQSRQRGAHGDNDSLPEVLQSPLISNLKASLSQAEAKLQDITTNLGKNHPDYKTTQAEIQSLQDRITQETTRVVESLGSTTQVNIRREAELNKALEDQRKRVLDLRQQRDQVANLQNDVTAAQRDLDAVTERYTQSNLESQAQQTSAVMLTPAVVPARPSSPKLALNVIVSIFLGGILGVGTVLLLEAMNRRVRGEVELSQLLAAPVLGRIGRVDFRPRRLRLRHA